MSADKSSFAKLSDSNYAEWNVFVHTMLIRKGLWEVMSGEDSMPLSGPNSKPVKTWKKKNAEAQAEIVLHVEVSQLPHVRDENAGDVWNNLKTMHLSHGLAL
jgi:hypothetical protein